MNFQQIKDFLKKAELPAGLDMGPHGRIFDLPRFVDSHLSVLEANSGNAAYLPYYHRLKTVAETLHKNLSK